MMITFEFVAFVADSKKTAKRAREYFAPCCGKACCGLPNETALCPGFIALCVWFYRIVCLIMTSRYLVLCALGLLAALAAVQGNLPGLSICEGHTKAECAAHEGCVSCRALSKIDVCFERKIAEKLSRSESAYSVRSLH